MSHNQTMFWNALYTYAHQRCFCSGIVHLTLCYDDMLRFSDVVTDKADIYK
jgi:hypothetical protein